ncbi:hypothetical protein PF010_g22844 [Phytophthora fragariae]|uniref:RxLR effector protein n=1 Tax=Phytophthora fragariae TaxID=53985 RepID=A0A6A3JU24_9STRA|nr:hypothetical protein PF011_g15080 [Phytophthora fragariae]KAE9079172.1 hypothetical protein PF010_g22844 [Phytophthora fragariae]KAE9188851.1 hypothetical protein PF004_g22381 [Phytophthora fragariae]KAE9301248.1 hypothetical protein PF008_g22811 [Phytophthora fragariae]
MIFFDTNAVVASLLSLLNMICAALTARSNSKAPPCSCNRPTHTPRDTLHIRNVNDTRLSDNNRKKVVYSTRIILDNNRKKVVYSTRIILDNNRKKK